MIKNEYVKEPRDHILDLYVKLFNIVQQTDQEPKVGLTVFYNQ